MQDVTRLVSVLIYKFGCKCTIHYQRGNPVIYISRRSVKALSYELMKHMPLNMHRKVIARLFLTPPIKDWV